MYIMMTNRPLQTKILQTNRTSHPSSNEPPSSSSTHGDSGTTQSQNGQSSSTRRPLTGKRIDTPSSPTDSHTNANPDHRSHHAEVHSRQTPIVATPRTLKGLPLPKTPGPHRQRPYSVERFVRDFDSRERARMGLVVEGKVASAGSGGNKFDLGTSPLAFHVHVDAGMGGLVEHGRRRSAGRLAEGEGRAPA